MNKKEKDLIVLGGGPGGYTAAFRAADLGRKVTIIERNPVLGGVCLNEGCIPSKTLLNLAEVIDETKALTEYGVRFQSPDLDIEKIKNHKLSVVEKLTSGLSLMAQKRGVEILQGNGSFLSSGELIIEGAGEQTVLTWKDLIIAAGSRPVNIPGIPYDDPDVWNSSDALELKKIPEHLVIIGGGVIGMEMAGIYYGLGSEISIIEMAGEIIPPADKDIKMPLLNKIKKQYRAVYTSTRVDSVERSGTGLQVTLEGSGAPESISADAVLVAVGRTPNGDQIGIDKTKISVDSRGFIAVDYTQKTVIDHIYAIGDITGNPMLAHRAVHQGKTAAEAACGLPAAFTPIAIPSVAYTNPEIAWVGLTEKEAREQNISYRKASFPWQASGRALSMGASNGVSKSLFDTENGKIIGAGIAGRNAGELIGEAVLAMEMGAVGADIGDTIHPHPTLSETFALTGEIEDGTITDLLPKK
ncbi:MAG: dihydrolipoyl dehydrogenase [Spirochaetales bacterium]|uniref:Dihydrolipoyl dehydrogenase n=1 Tax=Candidatus Thalassospirochaeta sargassi TaxID=3119039 RepID=A0AAJ1IA45_9SPIO|nr:dihydrolipoyl dehydrogenase [Spirochaetales bacterium]